LSSKCFKKPNEPPIENRTPTNAAELRRVVALVALLNLAYFGVEFVVAISIGSVSLKFHARPHPLPLSLTGSGALAINLTCAFMLARYRAHAGSLTKAAFLSARNDSLANIAIIGAASGRRRGNLAT
jgi:Co/Zn/Cd efflux system component